MTLSLRDVICCASWCGRFHSVTISRECVSICNPNANWSNEDGRRWQWYTTDISKLTKRKLYWMLNNCKRTRMERNFIKDNLMGIMYAHRNKSHWWMLLVTKINAFPFYWLSRHKSHFVLFIWGTLQGLNQSVCVYEAQKMYTTHKWVTIWCTSLRMTAIILTHISVPNIIDTPQFHLFASYNVQCLMFMWQGFAHIRISIVWWLVRKHWTWPFILIYSHYHGHCDHPNKWEIVHIESMRFQSYDCNKTHQLLLGEDS